MERDDEYKRHVAYLLASQIASAHPASAGSVRTMTDGIKTAAEVSLKLHRRWSAEEQKLARSAFDGAFGKVPKFGGGFDETIALGRERRSFENAAIEAALDYMGLARGLENAAQAHADGQIGMDEFIERATRSHTNVLSSRVDADIARNAAIIKYTSMTAVALLVIWWIVVFAMNLGIVIGSLVSLAVVVGCTIAYFTFNPYDHR